MHRRAHAERAGEIAQHVDALEALHRLVHRGLDALGIEQIRRQEKLSIAVLEGSALQIDQRKAGASLGDSGGDCAAEVAGSAGDHDGSNTFTHWMPPGACWRDSDRCRA